VFAAKTIDVVVIWSSLVDAYNRFVPPKRLTACPTSRCHHPEDRSMKEATLLASHRLCMI
jgi:hypothetical protein